MEQVFLKILNMSAVGGVVILIVLAARLLLRRAPKVFSYILWGVVLFRLVCPVSFESMIGFLPQREIISAPASPAPAPVETPKYNPPALDFSDTAVKLPPITSTVPANPTAVVKKPPSPLFFLSIAWLAGIGVMLSYSIISYLKLKRRLKPALHIEGNIYEYSELKTPFVLGFFRPKIYLPTGLSECEKSYILEHEKTHIKRLDFVVKPIAFLVLCVHWFNPLVWVGFAFFCKDMEMSCDEAVIKRLGSGIKQSYSSSLLSLGSGKRLLNPLAFGENDVGGRIKNVLSYKKPAFWVSIAALAAIIVLSFMLISNAKTSGFDTEAVAKNFSTALLEKYSALSLPEGVFADGKAFLYDLDSDGTPEIFFLYDNETGKPSTIVAYSIDRDSVKELGSFETDPNSANGNVNFDVYTNGENKVLSIQKFLQADIDATSYATEYYVTLIDGKLSVNAISNMRANNHSIIAEGEDSNRLDAILGKAEERVFSGHSVPPEDVVNDFTDGDNLKNYITEVLTEWKSRGSSLKLAQKLKSDDIESMELVASPSDEDKSYKLFSTDEFAAVLEAIKAFRGRFVENPENFADMSQTFYIKLKDGTKHTITNNANKHLIIDDEYFSDNSDLLKSWEFTGDSSYPAELKFSSLGEFYSASTDLLEVGRTAFESYYGRYSDGGDGRSITNYKLDEISLRAGDENEFCVDGRSSYETDGDYFLVGNGIPYEDGRAGGVCPDVYLQMRIKKMSRGHYEIIDKGTDGADVGLTPVKEPASISADAYSFKEGEREFVCKFLPSNDYQRAVIAYYRAFATDPAPNNEFTNYTLHSAQAFSDDDLLAMNADYDVDGLKVSAEAQELVEYYLVLASYTSEYSPEFVKKKHSYQYAEGKTAHMLLVGKTADDKDFKVYNMSSPLATEEEPPPIYAKILEVDVENNILTIAGADKTATNIFGDNCRLNCSRGLIVDKAGNSVDSISGFKAGDEIVVKLFGDISESYPTSATAKSIIPRNKITKGDFLEKLVASGKVVDGVAEITIPKEIPDGYSVTVQVHAFIPTDHNSTRSIDVFEEMEPYSKETETTTYLWEAGKTYSKKIFDDPPPDGTEVSFGAGLYARNVREGDDWRYRKITYPMPADAPIFVTPTTKIIMDSGEKAAASFTDKNNKTLTLALSLPNGWTLKAPDSGSAGENEDAMKICNGNGAQIGSLFWVEFELYEGADPVENYVSVYNSLMLGSVSNWNNEFKTLSSTTTATTSTSICKPWRNISIPGGSNASDPAVYTKGILSYDTELLKYIAINIDDNALTDEEWVALAESVKLS